MSANDAKAYLNEVTSVIPGIVSGNPKTKDDYAALLAAAARNR